MYRRWLFMPLRCNGNDASSKPIQQADAMLVWNTGTDNESSLIKWPFSDLENACLTYHTERYWTLSSIHKTTSDFCFQYFCKWYNEAQHCRYLFPGVISTYRPLALPSVHMLHTQPVFQWMMSVKMKMHPYDSRWSQCPNCLWPVYPQYIHWWLEDTRYSILGQIKVFKKMSFWARNCMSGQKIKIHTDQIKGPNYFGDFLVKLLFIWFFYTS